MEPRFTIVGGTYLEVCAEPESRELYGSGLRAAAALSNNVPNLNFISFIGEDFYRIGYDICKAYNIDVDFNVIENTIQFHYFHPLSTPTVLPDFAYDRPRYKIDIGDTEAVLLYGQVEAKSLVRANYLVYDPQNHIPWSETGCSATHLALVLNSNEAYLLSGLGRENSLDTVGKFILENEQAEVVVIKNGSRGATVVDRTGIAIVPVYKTTSVWPIGSGDIFSAVFAWQWMLEKASPAVSANIASICTAYYCQSRLLPLPLQIPKLESLPLQLKQQLVYIAGPFFTISERWLINEVRNKLLEFGNNVFSPLHDVGIGQAHEVAIPDLQAIQNSDVVLAIASGLDAGTLFEVGYARALNKRVVVFAENVTQHDLTMMIGSSCEIVDDFSTLIYQVSWI